MVQIILNLLNNAAKYSEPQQSIRLIARLDRNHVELRVRDHGIGIPADKLRNIFEPFTQVDPSWQWTQGGMGIGLSLVKEFVELHGGTVEARSLGLGQGSEFLVRLPVAAEDVAEPEVSAENTPGPCCRVLVVDDNRDAAATLSMILKRMGHEVRTAYEGETAVTQAEEFRPELVLMDLGMPKIDGYEAARRIREQPWGKRIFLVALTGWGAAEDRQRTKDAGFNSHLVKPVGMDILIRLLAEIPTREK